jgi:DNA invertase Pin-like site-specific DNA recombinase
MRLQELRISNPKRAALYIRMSTEHQDYSIANQTAALERYAEDHQMFIVKRFLDSGKSGLTLSGRHGLKDLLLAVISTQADFEHVLAYDVSRWGRFLDADESAYYEYTCKKANIKVHYCAEPFVNDNSVYSSLIKNLKRLMAGEYSRELSAKVHAGQVRLAQLGFRQGGAAGYGLRRQLVDKDGNVKGWLKPGDRKGFQSDRIVLTVGPRVETDIIRQIYQWFVVDRLYETQIARLLNHQEIGSEWTNNHVHQVLTNPKYIGTIVYNRTSGKLRQKRVTNAADKWVIREGAFEAIVNPALYEKAQQIIKDRRLTLDDYQILDRLSALLNKFGRLSTEIIDSDPETPCVQVITQRFRSLPSVYELVGYKPRKDVEGIAKRQQERAEKFERLGDAILAAVASGRLSNTFTICELRTACPGWLHDTYGAICAQYAARSEARPVKLQRVSRGQYRIMGARPITRNRVVTLDDSQVLERLSLLLQKSGRLSTAIISGDRTTPCVSVIKQRFGSLRAAYQFLGYSPVIDRVGVRKRFHERSEAREPGIMAEALLDAVESGRLAETFTVAQLKKICPGWAYGSYYTATSQHCREDVKGPIKLLRVGRGVYQIVRRGTV